MANLQAHSDNLICTFGYGNRKDYSALLEYIQKFNIKNIVDVRLKPRAWSRKWYGDSLEKLCESEDIKYISRASLGNISGCSHWVPPAEKEAKQSLSEVAEILETGSILLLCAELDCERCHRTEVASQLQDLTNAPIKHLR